MAENPVLGKSTFESSLEHLDIIDPLADERSLMEEVLVNIGDGARIRVDARLTPEQSRIPRPVVPGRLTATRGWRIQYPSQTRPLSPS